MTVSSKMSLGVGHSHDDKDSLELVTLNGAPEGSHLRLFFHLPMARSRISPAILLLFSSITSAYE